MELQELAPALCDRSLNFNPLIAAHERGEVRLLRSGPAKTGEPVKEVPIGSHELYAMQAIQALPYVLTVVLLAGFIGKAVGPKAGGVPYTKER